MNLKKRNDGFTLVELIVVIATLAILAGVAVPAYSGYVKKAEEAADYQLLSDINMAFASAYAFNGKNHIGLASSPKLKLNGNAVQGLSNTDANIADDFDAFFESSDTEFNVFNVKKIAYNPASGAFENDPQSSYLHNGTQSFGFNLGSKSDYANSIFADESSGLGTDVLLERVDDIIEWANSKGIDLSGYEDFQEFYGEWTEGITIEAGKENEAMMNALVMYTAQHSENLDGDALYQGVMDTGKFNYQDATGEDKVAAMALEYAVGMAYVSAMNALPEDERPEGYVWTDPTKQAEVLKAMEEQTVVDEYGRESDEKANPFMDWFATNGQSTIDGYLGAMDIISQNSDTLTQSQREQILNSGYTNEEFATIINNIVKS